MPLLARKASVYKCPHDVERKLLSDDARAHAEHVAVVVLHALVRGVRVVAQPGPHSANLVCRHARADAASADQHCAVYLAPRHAPTNILGVVRVVVAIRRVMSAQIEHFVPEAFQFSDYSFIQRHSTVIGGDSNFHLLALANQLASRFRNLLRREAKLLE